jgi:hypothetical protein
MITPIPGCGRRTRRLLAPLVAEAAAVPGADRYRKHFPASAHLWIVLRHVLLGGESLRQTHGELSGDADAWERLGLPQGISRAQLARSSTSRPSACAETLFDALATLARCQHRGDPTLARLQRIQAVDSTFIALASKLSPWSQHGGHAPGVRLHTGLDLAGSIPTSLHLTLADTHDAAALDARDLAKLKGWTLLIDLGYYGHRRFAELRATEVAFICPLQAQAVYVIETDHPVPSITTPEGDVVLRDETITLGSPNNRTGAVLPGMRLVTSQNANGDEHRFVTDRHDLPAAEVVSLYRKRWQIELCFRWLKHQLTLLHPFGTSREAVWFSILIAACVAILSSLIQVDRPTAVSNIAWLRGVGRAITTLPDEPVPPG